MPFLPEMALTPDFATTERGTAGSADAGLAARGGARALRTVSSRRASMAVFGARAALREECSMPGQERPAARARVPDSVVPDDHQSADHAAPGVPPSSSLAARTNRPAVAALIATLAAVAFTLARW